MADMAARDTIDRLLRSQDRLRESADRTSVAFYRLEQYARRAALAVLRMVGAKFPNNPKNSISISIQSSDNKDSKDDFTESVKKMNELLEKLSNKDEKSKWKQAVEVADDISKFTGYIGVINDTWDIVNKTKEIFNKNKSSNAAQQIVCVCKCCCDDKKTPPSDGPDRGNKRSSARRIPRTRTRGGDGGTRRSPLDKSAGERTKSNLPSNKSTAEANKPIADSEKKPRRKADVVPFPTKADTTQPPKIPEETLGDKTKPVTPGPSKESDIKDNQPTNLDDKTRPSTSPDSKKPPGPGPGSNNFVSGSGGFKAFEGLSKLGKSAMKYLGGSNPLGRTALGMMSIAAAEDKTAAVVDTLASAGGATVGSIIGSAILPGVGTVVGGMVGGWLGEKAGRFINNSGWFGKKKKEEESGPPVNSAALSSPASNLSLYPASTPLPPPGPGYPAVPNNTDLPAPTYNISVEGVQLNMPKEEIDEESLARKIGWEIVSKMKLAMDNRVAT
ncbi:hypothetical protein [Paenibacillus oceani]|uniref:Uncharacterized protein n=1 Tax=Paenibacillus oceani TaxID=2772510 RepID=A0A927C3A9_9BACL|nr:hypothetical protein [Paenibacillus oceani]MBD2860535.1 hypothetical protein [Paenibacillus oceani]